MGDGIGMGGGRVECEAEWEAAEWEAAEWEHPRWHSSEKQVI